MDNSGNRVLVWTRNWRECNHTKSNPNHDCQHHGFYNQFGWWNPKGRWKYSIFEHR